LGIIGILYSISINKLQKLPKNEEIKVSLETLDDFIRNYQNENLKHKDFSLICLDDCQKCFINYDKNQTKEIDFKFDEDCKVYNFDQYGTPSLTPIFGTFIDNEYNTYDICFRYDIDKHGGTKELVVECEYKSYYLGSKFDRKVIFETTQDIRDFKEELIKKVTD